MPLPTTSNVDRPRALGYGCRINDRYYRLAVAPDRRLDVETAPLEPPKVNTVENPDDIGNEFGQIFSRADFSGGEGLDFAHRRKSTDADTIRFWDSAHIDVTPNEPGQPASFTLLPVTAAIETSADTNLHMAYDGTALYMAEGQQVRRSTTFLDATPSFADDSPHAGDPAVTVNDLVGIGSAVYAALGASGIHKRSGGSWAAAFSAFAAVKVWTAKGFLLASSGTVLSWINLGTGAATTIVTLPAGTEWVDLRDAGAAILATATDGNIYAVGDDGAGGLELKGQTWIGVSATPHAVDAAQGLVFYSTREDTGSGAVGRLFRAELSSGTFTLTGATLVRKWGHETSDDSTDHTPNCLIVTRDAVFAGVDEHDHGAVLWKYDLASGGRSRHLDSATAGVVVDAIAVGGRLFFTVSGHGLYREDPATFETEGYVIGPLADFYKAGAKAWAGARLDHEALPDDTRVELYYTTDPAAIRDPDASAWVRAKNVTEGVDTSEAVLQGVESRYLAGMVKLHANPDQDERPRARGFAFRAYPGPGDVLVTLPVNVSDQIEMYNRRRQIVKGLGLRVYRSLAEVEGTYVECEVFDLDELLRGTVEQVSTPVISLSERGSPTAISYVKVRGRRVSEAGMSTSEVALGVGTLGVAILGGVEV